MVPSAKCVCGSKSEAGCDITLNNFKFLRVRFRYPIGNSEQVLYVARIHLLRSVQHLRVHVHWNLLVRARKKQDLRKGDEHSEVASSLEENERLELLPISLSILAPP